MRTVLFLFAGSVCFAQHIGIGVKGGVRVTDDIEGYRQSESKRYLVGPTVEVRLAFGFGVEADALYRRFGYTSSTDLGFASSAERARANSWEFPILARYQRRGLPYFIGGVAPRHMSGEAASSSIVINQSTGVKMYSSDVRNVDYGVDYGFVAGAGIELGAGRIHFSPEVRYVRWKDPPYSFYGSRGYYVLVPQNEVQLVIGMTWR